MAQKPAADRASRAQKTKKRLFQSASKLINKYGYDKVTIADISKRAGVSVGAFYHYYDSKTDIIVEFFKQIDVYYEDVVAAELTGDPDEDLEIFFRHYAKYHVDQGVEHTSMIIKVQSPFFLDETRYLRRKLVGIIGQAKTRGLAAEAYTAERIADFMLVIARGLLFDWVLAHGEYDLVEKMREYIFLSRQTFR
ncbi:MAG: TetR/AcrR family transcriptional regulator [Clostridiales Family XIII bacterium]|jgi:AcrR family transcriptional regulator|nr:TetR/AcrR family transcriptional regulator [Clostridiales Family XIII bacterium]